MRYTNEVLGAVKDLRDEQSALGAETFTETNDLIAGSLAYVGRAAAGVRRNERSGDDPLDMLLKGISLLVNAAENMMDEQDSANDGPEPPSL